MVEKQEAQWTPKTELGKKVASGEITSLDQALQTGKKILEPEIIDALVPDLKEEVIDVKSTQRMTAYGRKMQMRAVVIVGNGTGIIGIGIGKGAETRDAIAEAIRDAKKNLVKLKFGCGSWECACGENHSIPIEITGKASSTRVTLKAAPKGIGIVAGRTAKKVLVLAGLKDVWSFTSGRTRNALNTALAVIDAFNSLNKQKKGN
ncbi:MAG: 30S ribosomal protein S5 [Candidatus Micrarchaeota archaeon]